MPDEELSSLAGAMGSARTTAEQLAALAEALQHDKTRTPEAAALELRKSALRLAESSAKRLDTARQKAAEALGRLQKETAAPPPPRDAVALQIESEVRARLAALPQDKRTAAISAAIQSGDDVVTGAILRGPGFLSGLNDGEHEHARLRFREQRHPEKTAKMRRLEAALDDVDRGGNLLLSFVEKLSNTNTAKQAEAQASAASAALRSAAAAG